MNTTKLNTTVDGHETIDLFKVHCQQPPGIYTAPWQPRAANTTTFNNQNRLNPALTELNAQLAPWGDLLLHLELEPINPRFQPGVVSQVPFVRASANTQTNPTTWETGDGIVEAKQITPAYISNSCGVSQKERSQGLTLQDLIPSTFDAFGKSLSGLITGQINTSNFPNTPISAPAATFGASEAEAAFASIGKATTKNLVLSPRQFANLSHLPGAAIPAGGGSALGWNWIGPLSEWGSGVAGFATAPTSLILLTAFLPAYGPSVSTSLLKLEGINLIITINEWFSLAERKHWMSIDTIFGICLGDTSAGTVLTIP